VKILDANYLEAVTIAQNTRIKIEKVLIRAKKSSKNKNICSVIENLFSEIKAATDTIENYSRPFKEGYLIENSSGQFEIECINGGGSYPLCCGNKIEILINVDGWKTGRVERTILHNKGYYFYNKELKYPALYTGMKTRLRVAE
jgi:hypothetical protein